MQKRALKDLPLQEITLRKYEEPSSLAGRELSKKFLLSIGLLNPGESRDIIVDIFELLLESKKGKKILQIEAFLEKLKDKPGASAPNVRRQLRRLKDLKLIEKLPEGYRITEFGELKPIISSYVAEFLVSPALERVKQYAQALDSQK
jgi:DNA-binding transcriptional ArsR family regulator